MKKHWVMECDHLVREGFESMLQADGRGPASSRFNPPSARFMVIYCSLMISNRFLLPKQSYVSLLHVNK